MDTNVQKRINEWTKAPYDDDTIREISDLVKNNDEKELADRFHTILKFGTGGLRGLIGAGTNRMNIYTVGMATQGLANYILKKGRSDDGVVIARDSRRKSDIFAIETAAILAGNGIRVYYFDDITPTPLCSFAIRQLNAVSGIVVTASHNPPVYNGYKVYWDDGGQIVPPFDSEIIKEVENIQSIQSIKKIDFNKGIKAGLINQIGGEILQAYTTQLEKRRLYKSTGSAVTIVYTPLHGTGYKIVPDMLRHFGFENVFTVTEQSEPDGDFPTVTNPNPEEPAALECALELARKVDADIVMATDPDADRMGIGFKDSSGEYRLINGNQIGTMLQYYLLLRLSEENSLPSNAAVVKTIVTTDLQEDIAAGFKCDIDNVLTGFKWIAMKMKKYDEDSSKTFIFGGEESYGYLPVDFVRDKDSVSSCYFFAEMTNWLISRGRSLEEFLDEIYIKYSLYMEDLHSVTLKGIDGMEKISSIMNTFRNNPPEEFAGSAIVKVADIRERFVKDIQTGALTPITDLPTSDVIQFFLEDGSKITMRPSGTEPKIKFYFSVKCDVNSENIEKNKIMLGRRLKKLREDLSARISGI